MKVSEMVSEWVMIRFYPLGRGWEWVGWRKCQEVVIVTGRCL